MFKSCHGRSDIDQCMKKHIALVHNVTLPDCDQLNLFIATQLL